MACLASFSLTFTKIQLLAIFIWEIKNKLLYLLPATLIISNPLSTNVPCTFTLLRVHVFHIYINRENICICINKQAAISYVLILYKKVSDLPRVLFIWKTVAEEV